MGWTSADSGFEHWEHISGSDIKYTVGQTVYVIDNDYINKEEITSIEENDRGKIICYFKSGRYEYANSSFIQADPLKHLFNRGELFLKNKRSKIVDKVNMLSTIYGKRWQEKGVYEKNIHNLRVCGEFLAEGKATNWVCIDKENSELYISENQYSRKIDDNMLFPVIIM